MSDLTASTPNQKDRSDDSKPGNPADPNSEELKSAVEVWKQIISVQMHFNDIEMRIRNLYVTILLANVAATGWVLDRRLKLELSALGVHYATALLGAGLIASYLFYFSDRYWYHHLLKGAVDQGRLLDQHYGAHIRALGLTSQISGASPIMGFRRRKWGRALSFLRIISPPRPGEGPNDLHSTAKIELFYKTPMRVLWLLVVLSLLFGGVTWSGRSVFQLVAGAIRACA